MRGARGTLQAVASKLLSNPKEQNTGLVIFSLRMLGNATYRCADVQELMKRLADYISTHPGENGKPLFSTDQRDRLKKRTDDLYKWKEKGVKRDNINYEIAAWRLTNALFLHPDAPVERAPASRRPYKGNCNP